MSMKETLAAHLRAAEAEGRNLSDAEATLIEALSSNIPDPAPVPVTAPVYASSPRTVVAGLTRDQLSSIVQAIHEGRSMSVQASASLFDTATPYGTPANALGPNVSLVQYFAANGAGMLSGMGRTVGHIQTTGALVAEDWVAGNAKKEIAVTWNDAATHTPAAYTLLYEPNTIDVPGLSVTLSGLLSRAVVSRENAAIAEDLLDAAQAGTDNADAIIAAANAMAEVIDNGGAPGLFLASSDAYAALIASAQFGFSSEVNTTTLFGLPLIGVGGLASNTIVAADPRSVGLAYSGPTVYVGPSDPTKNEMIVRVESNLATVIFDPYSIATTVITSGS